MDEISLRRSHLRTESLTFCFSICSLQSPSFQVLGASFSYRRELPRLSPLYLSYIVIVETSLPTPLRFLLIVMSADLFQNLEKKGVNKFQITVANKNMIL